MFGKSKLNIINRFIFVKTFPEMLLISDTTNRSISGFYQANERVPFYFWPSLSRGKLLVPGWELTSKASQLLFDFNPQIHPGSSLKCIMP